MIRNKTGLSLFFSGTIALLPFLSDFYLPVVHVDFGTVCILLCTFFFILSGKKIGLKKFIYFLKKNAFLPTFLYVLILTPILFAFGEFSSAFFLRYARFCVELVCFYVCFLGDLFDFVTFFKTLRVFVYFSCAMLIFQTIMFRVFALVIDNPLLLLPRGFFNELYADASISGKFFRPSALFLEPAHLAQYALLMFLLLLFAFRKIHWADCIVCGFAIVLTTSGIGILLLAILCLLYFFVNRFSYKTLIAEVFFVGLFLAVWFSDVGKTFRTRVFTDNVDAGGNAVLARFGAGFAEYAKLKPFYKFSGTGYGNVVPDVYYNGLEYVIYTCGIIGLSLLALCLVIVFIRGRKQERMAVVLFCGLLVSCQIFSSASLIYYGIFAGLFGPLSLGAGSKTKKLRNVPKGTRRRVLEVPKEPNAQPAEVTKNAERT